KIRNVPQLADIPIVILTGKDGLTDRVRSRFLGATDFLAKPVQPAQIMKTVRQYVPKHATQ
ncbi:MAG: response regulator, partial [Cyanobacteria bacterium P01_H01_bin.121]